MDNKKILYIGPYNEESNRGRSCLTNIRALNSKGHILNIVPIYYPGERFKNTPQDIISLENNTLSQYDICIQHCDPMQYSFHNSINKNIGIYSPNSITHEPIINTRLSLVDNLIVNSKKVYEQLPKVVGKDIMSHVKYCPHYIDIDYVKNYKKEKVDWADDSKYYFYSELEFTEEYDWEKIIYVYLTTFANKDCELIIKTKDIEDEREADEITKKIQNIAMYTNIKLQNNNPKVLNGIFSEKTMMNIYNTIDCFIDCTRTYNHNTNILTAAALGKDIVCNSELSAADLFSGINKVDGYACNINYGFNNDLFSSSMYEIHYSMECNSLREIMNDIYINRYNNKDKNIDDLNIYNISNINELLCL